MFGELRNLVVGRGRIPAVSCLPQSVVRQLPAYAQTAMGGHVKKGEHGRRAAFLFAVLSISGRLRPAEYLGSCPPILKDDAKGIYSRL